MTDNNNNIKPTKPVGHCMYVAALGRRLHLAVSLKPKQSDVGTYTRASTRQSDIGSMIGSMRVSTLRGPWPWFANRDQRRADGSLCGRRDPEHRPQYGPDVLFDPPGCPRFVENVATFVAFLREGGGFSIW